MARCGIMNIFKFPQKKRRMFSRKMFGPGRASGFTLVEIVISILIVMVLVTGVMAHQYRSSYDVKRSEIRTAAARLSMLLLEGWKGAAGVSGFDPVTVFSSEIMISKSTFGPSIPADKSGTPLTLLGYYDIQAGDVCYYVTLSWSDASSQEPRVLNAMTAWRRDYSQGTLQGDEEFVRYSTFFVNY